MSIRSDAIALAAAFVVCACGSKQQGTSAPSNLACTSASPSQVVLSWKASTASGVTGYEVDRQPLGGSWAKVATVTGTTYTDAITDGYATYAYQVKAVSGGTTTAASNTITVGPPTTGFTPAVVLPDGADPSRFGTQLAMTRDANDDPVLAYDWLDPNGDGDLKDSSLWVVTWNRTKSAWNAPVQVDTVGSVDDNPGQRQVVTAFDASTGTLGIAYQRSTDPTKGGSDIVFARSTDGGTTWTLSTVHPADNNASLAPALAMAGGHVWVAYYHDNDACSYIGCSRFRVASGTGAGTWNDTMVPQPTTAGGAAKVPPSLAVDSAGNVGFAFWSDPDSTNGVNYDSVLGFWKPGSAMTVEVTDTNDVQNDHPSVALAFDGTSPVVAFTAQIDPNAGGTSVFISRSSDGGTTFAAPVTVPGDHSASPGFRTAIAIDSKGDAAIAYEPNGGSSDATCGNPKLARSSDLSSWMTCSPDTDKSKGVEGDFVSVAFADNGKLYISFKNDGGQNMPPQLGSGVYLWREP